MPKAEKGTPKDIANRMKARGLQKLKFYCQMCSKQCRGMKDENGFKCHMTSDSHLRNMMIFRENAGGMMDSFSREFESSYLETLRRRHGTQRMNANNVYQEVIQDREHVHMNSTKWATLSDFVQYLGRRGLVIAEETERGWYVTYVDRDPAKLARGEAMRARAEADAREERLAAERREGMRMEAAKALDRAGCEVDRRASEIGNREDGASSGIVEMRLTGKIVGGGGGSSRTAGGKRRRRGGAGKISLLVEEDDDDDDDDGDDDAEGDDAIEMNVSRDNRDPTKERRATEDESKRSRKTESINEERGDDTTKKETKKRSRPYDRRRDDAKKDTRKDHWLYRDIIVRIISKSLANGEYYKRKAVVNRVIDKYEAEVEVLENSRGLRGGEEEDGVAGDVLRIDQDDLETVIPKVMGEKVRILNGKYAGKKARVRKLDKADYRAELKLADDDDGERIVVIDYEDFSAIA
ncbi:hypothetical protein ACHAW5_004102 [Stephanodiscus triporus]|uniref:DNA/RNA-binding protein Kin17 WH-like domain-containing protein n=1 Tax=Stephanodiscus triporus TaxID=2934178 RepID=A0ABD3NCL8_9STRA